MAKFQIDDGYSSFLVEGATFVGKYQIPELMRQETSVPKELIPFDKRKKYDGKDIAIDFYMHDKTFRQVISHADRYVNDLKQFRAVITPDCSLYQDMPLCLQITNTYLNRAVGFFFQKQGIAVIPNVRWGDERSYEFCFLGVPKNGMVAISTHGCIRSNENKEYFRKGLKAMIAEIRPQIVLVHGDMPDSVFSSFSEQAQFVHYESYISKIRRAR